MLKEKDKLLLRQLRNNSRKSLAKISSDTGIPVSSLFDSLKKLEEDVIKKHVSIVDFIKLGYGLKAHFAIVSKNKPDVREFLMKHKNVNTLNTSINGYDFFVECIFRDMKEMSEFRDQLDGMGVKNFYEHIVVEELKKEGFGF